MKLFMLLITTTMLTSSTAVIFDFNKNTPLTNWYVVDDVVMGGRSNGTMQLHPDGHGWFKGNVSLENNGGFSSIRYRFNPIAVKEFSTIKIRVKGDGKKYQFRIKDNKRNYYSYIQYFTTSKEWETLSIPLKDMYPAFRGYQMDMPNFDADKIEEMAILVGNKKAESFELLLDKIWLE